MENDAFYRIPTPPTTAFSHGKTLTDECKIVINGKSFIKRAYDDDCVELLRFNIEQEKWSCLCFKSLDAQNKAQQIREAVRNNFDLNK